MSYVLKIWKKIAHKEQREILSWNNLPDGLGVRVSREGERERERVCARIEGGRQEERETEAPWLRILNKL